MPNIRITIFFLWLLILCACNNKEPETLPYEEIAGFVIGKETCDVNQSNAYWLLDFTVYPNQPQIGDTLLLNGAMYTNVLKVKGLDEDLQEIGMRVLFDYKTVTPDKVVTSGCTIANPVTYPLKELFIIHQFEIR